MRPSSTPKSGNSDGSTLPAIVVLPKGERRPDVKVSTGNDLTLNPSDYDTVLEVTDRLEGKNDVGSVTDETKGRTMTEADHDEPLAIMLALRHLVANTAPVEGRKAVLACLENAINDLVPDRIGALGEESDLSAPQQVALRDVPLRHQSVDTRDYKGP